MNCCFAGDEGHDVGQILCDALAKKIIIHQEWWHCKNESGIMWLYEGECGQVLARLWRQAQLGGTHTQIDDVCVEVRAILCGRGS